MDFSQLTSASDINLLELALNLMASFVFALLLGWLSQFIILTANAKKNTKGFLILIPTVVLVFSIIKASTALSLGLVGALSIIRFRTPVKDSDELLTLFLAIGLGIGLGSGHLLTTSLAFVLIALALGIYGYISGNWVFSGLYLSIQSDSAQGSDWDIKTLITVLDEYRIKYKLRKFADTKLDKSAVFILAPRKPQDLDSLKASLKSKLPSSATIEFLSSEL